MANNGVSLEWKAVQRPTNESANWTAKQTRMGVCPRDCVYIPPHPLSAILFNGWNNALDNAILQ